MSLNQTLDLCIFRSVVLPVEIRNIIKLFFTKVISDHNIHRLCYWYRATCKPTLMQYGHIEYWDTSLVTDMSYLFYNQDSNHDISRWDVSNVRFMTNMFKGNKTFNQPLGKWNVSKVENMFGMFCFAENFNQPIDHWNVSQVTQCEYMFYGATAFNQKGTP